MENTYIDKETEFQVRYEKAKQEELTPIENMRRLSLERMSMVIEYFNRDGVQIDVLAEVLDDDSIRSMIKELETAAKELAQTL